jgi:hypothetical protein
MVHGITVKTITSSYIAVKASNPSRNLCIIILEADENIEFGRP